MEMKVILTEATHTERKPQCLSFVRLCTVGFDMKIVYFCLHRKHYIARNCHYYYSKISSISLNN